MINEADIDVTANRMMEYCKQIDQNDEVLHDHFQKTKNILLKALLLKLKVCLL